MAASKVSLSYSAVAHTKYGAAWYKSYPTLDEAIKDSRLKFDSNEKILRVSIRELGNEVMFFIREEESFNER